MFWFCLTKSQDSRKKTKHKTEHTMSVKDSRKTINPNFGGNVQNKHHWMLCCCGRVYGKEQIIIRNEESYYITLSIALISARLLLTQYLFVFSQSDFISLLTIHFFHKAFQQ